MKANDPSNDDAVPARIRVLLGRIEQRLETPDDPNARDDWISELRADFGLLRAEFERMQKRSGWSPPAGFYDVLARISWEVFRRIMGN